MPLPKLLTVHQFAELVGIKHIPVKPISPKEQRRLTWIKTMRLLENLDFSYPESKVIIRSQANEKTRSAMIRINLPAILKICPDILAPLPEQIQLSEKVERLAQVATQAQRAVKALADDLTEIKAMLKESAAHISKLNKQIAK